MALLYMLKSGMYIRHIRHLDMKLKVLTFDPKTNAIVCECIIPPNGWDNWGKPGQLKAWRIDLNMWLVIPQPYKSHLPEWL